MKILIIKAHPLEDSFCHALADEYGRGASTAGNEVEVVKLGSLNLEPYLKEGQKEKVILSQELQSIQRQISASRLLVFAYPIWWATPPALLKLFIEIILLPGFAYKYHKRRGLLVRWDKLLKGRSARLIATMDGPPVYYRCYLRDPGYKMMNANLRFCGVKPVRRSYFGSVKLSSERMRKRWLNKSYKLGLAERGRG
jgi:NAD(P)H dehydrogenase (quinone)